MNYYNQNMINQLMRQKDNIDNMINQYSQQPPVQNIINTIAGAEFEARILKEDEEVSNVFVNKKTMILDKKNKKLYVKEINGDISEQYEIVIPLDEKDKKILELENKLKEMEVRVNEYSRYDRTDEQISKPNANANVNDKPTTKANDTTISKQTK